VTLNDSFLQVSRAVKRVSSLRRSAWLGMQEHLGCQHLGRRKRDVTSALLGTLPKVLVLASSSRGGTSVTAELLQWQGADCDVATGRMLTLPGEEKPHLVLSGLAFPTRQELFDNLEPEDASRRASTRLLEELRSEIGYPAAHCTDLDLFSMQLYRRLLLQWPLQMITLDQNAAIHDLARCLRRTFGEYYCDSVSSRRSILACCVDCFPFIRPSFYDCCPAKEIGDAQAVNGGTWSIEEPPFIIPPPWRNATAQDLAHGSLLLRDPSNAWRLPFWRALFATQRIHVIHLVRDARESIQGLCDGWNYAFGFQTLPSEVPLDIPGYSNVVIRGEDAWKKHRLNFSVDRELSRALIEERRRMTLVQICSHQWRAAHQRIVGDIRRLALPFFRLPFSAVREDPVGTFRRLCQATHLEFSSSGIAYAISFRSRWVMATVSGLGASHERWRHSPYADEICEIAIEQEFPTLSPIGTSATLVGPQTGIQSAASSPRSQFVCASA
jgi:hypothetical protein